MTDQEPSSPAYEPSSPSYTPSTPTYDVAEGGRSSPACGFRHRHKTDDELWAEARGEWEWKCLEKGHAYTDRDWRVVVTKFDREERDREISWLFSTMKTYQTNLEQTLKEAFGARENEQASD